MGHYDDSGIDYEDKELKKCVRKEMKGKLKELSLDELHFVETILDDIGSYRTFFRIIRDGVDTSGNLD